MSEFLSPVPPVFIQFTDSLFRFFERIDRVLRRAVGVSETAPTDTYVAPAPEPESESPVIELPTKQMAAELDTDASLDDNGNNANAAKLNLPDGVEMGEDGIPVFKLPSPGMGEVPQVVMGDDGIPDVVLDTENIKVTRDEL